MERWDEIVALKQVNLRKSTVTNGFINSGKIASSEDHGSAANQSPSAKKRMASTAAPLYHFVRLTVFHNQASSNGYFPQRQRQNNLDAPIFASLVIKLFA